VKADMNSVRSYSLINDTREHCDLFMSRLKSVKTWKTELVTVAKVLDDL